MGDIQRALNMLSSTLAGAGVAIGQGIKGMTQAKGTTPTAGATKQASQNTFNPQAVNFRSQRNLLSAVDVESVAFQSANNAIMQKARARQMRKPKVETGKKKNAYTFEGGKQ